MLDLHHPDMASDNAAGLFSSDATWMKTQVLDARAVGTREFDLDEFARYRRIRILTYSSSVPMLSTLFERFNGLYKAEVIHRRGPWRSWRLSNRCIGALWRSAPAASGALSLASARALRGIHWGFGTAQRQLATAFEGKSIR